MSVESRKILEMLAEGKIDVTEAERLLSAVECPTPEPGETQPQRETRKTPRFLRVRVDEKQGDRVDIRIPLQLVRAGVKLASLIPQQAQAKIDSALNEKGIGFSIRDLSPDTIDQILESISDLSVDVAEAGGDTVRVFCE